MAQGSGVRSSVASIGTSAAQIVSGRSQRDGLVVQNLHATNNLYVGDSTVTTSTGVKVVAGGSITVDELSGPLYGIADGASTDVRVMEVF